MYILQYLHIGIGPLYLTYNGPHSWNTSRNFFSYKSFVKLFWCKFSYSWKCLYFQNVSWLERNVHLLVTTCECCIKQSVFVWFSFFNWWHWILMHCQHNILQVCLLNSFFIAEIHCHIYPAVQSIEEGRDKYYTDQSSYNNWTTKEKVILQVIGFLYSVLFFKIR